MFRRTWLSLENLAEDSFFFFLVIVFRGLFSGSGSRILSDCVVLGLFSMMKIRVAFSPWVPLCPRMKSQKARSVTGKLQTKVVETCPVRFILKYLCEFERDTVHRSVPMLHTPEG